MTSAVLSYVDGDDQFHLTDEKLDITKAYEGVQTDSAGAISSFIGTTRDNFEGKRVTSLVYEAFPEMAIEEMKKIVQQIRNQWPVSKIYIAHKIGSCPVGDISVIIFVSSEHRVEALKAVQFAIDALKATVPIWKKVSEPCLYFFSKNL